VELTWSASSDDQDGITYCVYRNDRPVAFTEWTVFSDDKVNPEGNYRYQVCALDASMNQSDRGDVLNVATPAGADTAMPLIWNLEITEIDGTNVVFTWETDERADSHAGWHILYQSPTLYASDMSMTQQHQLVINGLAPNVTYSFYVASVDAAGNTNKYASKTFQTDSSGRLRNEEPTLDGIGAQRAYAGEQIVFDLVAFDLDPDDSLTFDVSGAPADALFDSVTGAFSWQTEAGDEGIHRMTFSVTDGKDTDTEDVVLFVYSNTVPQKLLSVDLVGVGQGMVSNALSGQRHSQAWQELIDQDAAVDLKALPGSDSEFGGWSGALSETSVTCQIVMTNHLFITAQFNCRDTDGDGIPDTWEEEHGGSATGMPPEGDADGDGYNNQDEWIAGTVPTNPASLPAVYNMQRGSNGPVVNWPSASNRFYRILFSSDLYNSQDAFEIIADNVPGDPPQNSYTDQREQPFSSGFYRVETKLTE
jgi:hypothetical protein